VHLASRTGAAGRCDIRRRAVADARVKGLGERDLRISDKAGAIPARLRLRPYRFDGSRIGSRSASRANRAQSFRRRTAGPSRRDRARFDGGNPCTKRSTGRGRRQHFRASSAGRARISRIASVGALSKWTKVPIIYIRHFRLIEKTKETMMFAILSCLIYKTSII
jgi:hypothetical protein